MEENEKTEVEQLRLQLALERKKLEDERKKLELERQAQQDEIKLQREVQRKLLDEREKKDVDELRQKLDIEWKKLDEERKQLECDKIKQEDQNKEMHSTPATNPKGSAATHLLLCKVCGDTANGMHYRALTCEGCKIFFRRNSKRQDNLQCSNEENKGTCTVDESKRRFCAYCRFKKCLKVGMQIGRVWDKERCKTRKPMKKIPKSSPIKVETDEQSESSNVLPACNTDPAATCSSVPATSTTCTATTSSSVKDEFTPEQASLNLLVTTAFQNALKVYETAPRQTKSSLEELKNQVKQSDLKITDLKGLGGCVAINDSNTTNNESVSVTTTPFSTKDELKPLDAENLSRRGQSPTSNESSNEDEYDEEIHKHIMESILLELKQMIMFIKALPTFLELACEDQASLIKETFVEFLTIKASAFYDAKQKVFISSCVPGDVYTMSDVKLGGFESLLKSMVPLSEKMNKINFTPDELALLCAVCILTPDRPVLSEEAKKTLGKHNDQLVEILCASGRINHPDDPHFFPKVVSLLTELRNHSENFMEHMMQLKLKGQTIQPILSELFDA